MKNARPRAGRMRPRTGRSDTIMAPAVTARIASHCPALSRSPRNVTAMSAANTGDSDCMGTARDISSMRSP